MTFQQWYDKHVVKPAYQDYNGCRVVHSTDPYLWHLRDYRVTTRGAMLVFMTPKSCLGRLLGL